MVAGSSLMKRGVQRHHALAGRRMPAQQVAPCRSGIARQVAVPRTSVVMMSAAASSGASSGVAVKEAVVEPSLVKFDKLGSTEELSHDEPEHVEEVARGTSGSVVLDKRTPNKATVLRSIVFVTSEVAPWSKTGGLADVVGSLPYALAARGHRVMVVAPRYSNYKEAIDTGVRVTMLDAEVGYFHYRNKGVDFVFVDHPAYPRPGGLYSDQHGPYGDNQFRFTLLSLAACEAPFHLKLEHTAGQPPSMYGEDVVFIANDWHAALVPVYIAAKYRPHGVYKNARSILAIHNLLHQGVFPPSTYAGLGLPGHWYGALEWQYPPHQRQGSYAEEGRSVNHLKAGIAVCDRLVTVSAGYSEEIKTWLGGWGMDGLLTSRSYVLNGIINGIDTDEWNPATDPHLAANYDETNFVEGKRKNKLALQKELGLPQNENIPLVAFIGRLDPQKGADILLQAAPRILNQSDTQLVCLGSGTQDLENGLRWLESAFPSRARGWVGFNVPFSHRLTAAADILVMPSRFEPCGLNQLYAMRYGTVPLAHKTGGLRDTVIDFNPWKQSGTGWTYTDCSAQGLVDGMSTALMTYKQHRKDFEGLQLRGMQRDASWDLAAQQYEQIITWAVQDPPYVK